MKEMTQYPWFRRIWIFYLSRFRRMCYDLGAEELTTNNFNGTEKWFVSTQNTQPSQSI